MQLSDLVSSKMYCNTFFGGSKNIAPQWLKLLMGMLVCYQIVNQIFLNLALSHQERELGDEFDGVFGQSTSTSIHRGVPELMNVITTSICLAQALEYLSVVWAELILAALAAMTYFTFSSKWVMNRLRQAPTYGEPLPGPWVHVLAGALRIKQSTPTRSPPQTSSADSSACGRLPNSLNTSSGQTPHGRRVDEDMSGKMLMRANDQQGNHGALGGVA